MDIIFAQAYRCLFTGLHREFVIPTCATRRPFLNRAKGASSEGNASKRHTRESGLLGQTSMRADQTLLCQSS
eukprot:SAG11_NODE_13529_length_651_cov_0.833333_1_plen_71_part_10